MIGWSTRPVGAVLGAWLAVVAVASTASRQIRQAPRLESLTTWDAARR